MMFLHSVVHTTLKDGVLTLISSLHSEVVSTEYFRNIPQSRICANVGVPNSSTSASSSGNFSDLICIQ